MINSLEFKHLLEKVKNESPLIHSITNPISINLCANIALAVGAKPIMAEHPLEVSEITKISKALALNLGNITDARLESIEISIKTAKENNIPSIIDMVGVSCSKLRYDYCKKIIEKYKPDIIKGNMSEIKAILGLESSSIGVDVGKDDSIDESNLDSSTEIAKKLALQTGTTVVVTGKIDIITDGKTCYVVKNGNEMLSRITGTGCALTELIGCYLPYADSIAASLLALLVLEISSEIAIKDKGNYTFMSSLIDEVSLINIDKINKYSKYEKIGE